MDLVPHEVEVGALPLAAYEELIGQRRTAALLAGAARARQLLEGHTVWNVNSTATGGGVAEMLRVLVGYARGAGIESRWLVLEADETFFAVTKRLHNRIHGVPGDTGTLGRSEAGHYGDVLAANAAGLGRRLRAGDVVLLHDPQTAGLVEALLERGLRVLWRCHIGSSGSNAWTEEAWSFLRPFLESCRRFVFSRADFVPPWIAPERVSIIAPSIDPFSPKNQPIATRQLRRVLAHLGLWAGSPGDPVRYRRHDGSWDVIRRRATVVTEGGPWPEATPPVAQVSRWDHLKDMAGVLAGFAEEVVPRIEGVRLALVGPATEGVADDPDGAAVYAEVLEQWHRLGPEARRRTALVTLPMEDVDENAAMVNALQRASSVIVQKSLVEGFGLTVAEGMFKAKPVVASRVGGIIDQVVDGTGFLLEDPADLVAFGSTLTGLLESPARMARMGTAGRRHVLDRFVGDRHLLALADLLEDAVGQG